MPSHPPRLQIQTPTLLLQRSLLGGSAFHATARCAVLVTASFDDPGRGHRRRSGRLTIVARTPEKVEHYRLMLALAPYIASRNHFSSADGFREYLAECHRAREYLGISQGGRNEQWTDDDERHWPARIVVVADP